MVQQGLSSSDYKQYRASKRHGDVTLSPGFDRVGGMVAENRRRRGAGQGGWAEGDAASLAGLFAGARQQMIRDALRYTSAYRDVQWAKGRLSTMNPSDPLVFMAGHQPTLFHPGVWFKNFALSHLGAVHNALPINLVIDNDVSTGNSIRVPTIVKGEVRAGLVPLGSGGGGVPYEQTEIQDREVFDQFGRAVSIATGGLVGNPCVTPLWRHARDAVARCGVAACALSQARHALEADIGLHTLELPLGVLCRGSAHAEFALTILRDLPRFQACYNQETDHYRAAHRIRSSAHPVPYLQNDGQWFEAPFWVYGNDSPSRRPVWARRVGNQITLSDSPGHPGPDTGKSSTGSAIGRHLTIDLGQPHRAAEQLADQVDANFKLRPRALVTTMYARLILSDLFLHGIGGGKYDQLGDRIIRAFYGITPPEFMVISATVLLPQARDNVGVGAGAASPRRALPIAETTSRIRSLHRKLRDCRFQPERFADAVDLDAELLAEKRRLLSDIPPKGMRKNWHHQVAEVNRQLAAQLTQLRESYETQLALLKQRQRRDGILASREHPFCIFELEDLVSTYRRMLA